MGLRRRKRRGSTPMTSGFQRTTAGISAVFDVMQVGVLRRWAADMGDLMQPPADGSSPEPLPAEGNTGSGAGTSPDDPLAALFADFADGPTSRPDDPVLA